MKSIRKGFENIRRIRAVKKLKPRLKLTQKLLKFCNQKNIHVLQANLKKGKSPVLFAMNLSQN